MKIKCPNKDCEKVLTIPDEYAGKKGKCSGCGTSFVVPSPKQSGSGSSSGSSGSKSAFKAAREKANPQPKQAPGKGKSRPSSSAAGAGSARPKRPQRDADEFSVDEDLYADDDLYGGDLYEDDLYEDSGYGDDYGAEDDDYGAPMAAPRSSKKSGGSKGSMSKVRVGVLLVAIGTCVLAGGLAMSIFSEFLGEVGLMMITSMAGSAEDMRKEMESLPPQQRFEKAMEFQKKVQGRVESASKVGDMGQVFFKIGQILTIPAIITCVVGYIFCLFAPNKNGALGLGIAALVLCALNLMLPFIFRVLPLMTEDKTDFIHAHQSFVSPQLVEASIFGSRGDMVGRIILSLFLDLLFAAEIMLFALFLGALATMKKDRAQKGDCMKVMYLMIGFAGATLLMYILCMIDWDVKPPSIWPLYIIWFFSWGANIVLGIALFFHIRNLFYTKSMV